LGLTIGAGCGMVHHAPEILTFTGDATGVAASKVAEASSGFCGFDMSALQGLTESLPKET